MLGEGSLNGPKPNPKGAALILKVEKHAERLDQVEDLYEEFRACWTTLEDDIVKIKENYEKMKDYCTKATEKIKRLQSDQKKVNEILRIFHERIEKLENTQRDQEEGEAHSEGEGILSAAEKRRIEESQAAYSDVNLKVCCRAYISADIRPLLVLI